MYYKRRSLLVMAYRTSQLVVFGILLAAMAISLCCCHSALATAPIEDTVL